MTEEEYMKELRERGDVLVRTVLDILKVRADPVTRTAKVVFRQEMKFSEELVLSCPLLVGDVFLDNLVRVAENELKTMLRTELLRLRKCVRDEQWNNGNKSSLRFATLRMLSGRKTSPSA